MRAAWRTCFGLGKGEDAAETEMESEIERLPRLRLVAREAVHDAAATPVRAQHFERVVPGFARVDDDGLAELGGERKLPLEDRALHFARREIVMVIEADFAHGEHLWDESPSSRSRANVSSVAFDASCGCTPMVA